MRGKAESICSRDSGQRGTIITVFGPRYTSCSGTSGGPSAISSALVPGRMRRDAPVSTERVGNLPWSSNSDTPGDVGMVWSSAIGGGDGSRGDDAGERAAMGAVDKRRGGEESAQLLRDERSRIHRWSKLPWAMARVIKLALTMQGRHGSIVL